MKLIFTNQINRKIFWIKEKKKNFACLKNHLFIKTLIESQLYKAAAL